MAQANVYGSLQYSDHLHGWALELGYNVAHWMSSLWLKRTRQAGSFDRNEIQEETARINQVLQQSYIMLAVPLPDNPPSGSEFQMAMTLQNIHNDIKNNILDHFCRAFYTVGCVFECLIAAREFEEYGYNGPAARLGHDIAWNDINNLPAAFPGVFGPPFDPETMRLAFKGANGASGVSELKTMLMDRELVILLVLANPFNTTPLQLGLERTLLEQSLVNSPINGSFRLEVLYNPSPDAFGPALVASRPHIVHFSGHGTPTGSVVFTDREGNARAVPTERLAELLSLARQHRLKGVILNACYTADQITQLVPMLGQAVVMQGPIADTAAINFSGQFYAYLGITRSFETAFQWAERGVRLEFSSAYFRPQLVGAGNG